MEIKRKKMIFNSDEIKAILPQRYPFLMLDRVIEITDTTAVGIKNLSVNEAFFEGHFSNKAMMPGNLIAECLAQISAFVGIPYQDMKAIGNAPQIGMLVASNMKFLQPAIPGDCLLLQVKVRKLAFDMAIFYGEASVEGETIAKGEFTIAYRR